MCRALLPNQRSKKAGSDSQTRELVDASCGTVHQQEFAPRHEVEYRRSVPSHFWSWRDRARVLWRTPRASSRIKVSCGPIGHFIVCPGKIQKVLPTLGALGIRGHGAAFV